MAFGPIGSPQGSGTIPGPPPAAAADRLRRDRARLDRPPPAPFRSPGARRAVVLVTLAATATAQLAGMGERSAALMALGLTASAVVVAGFILLQWLVPVISLRRTAALTDWERSLRDRAYSTAYAVLFAVLLALALAVTMRYLWSTDDVDGDDAIRAGLLLVLLAGQLPAAVALWLDPRR